ncbi:MAG: IclR family transcriptional regulator [Caulobacterales bacterium]|nr:IclR family transcriptional regulator [Caulobacterales bacterium]
MKFTYMTENVRSAARVLELVEFLAGADSGASLSEATGSLSAPKSSTLMLLRTLVNRGYAYRDNDNDRYFLSPDFRAGAFGWVAQPYARLTAVARPVMEALSEEVGETTTLGVFGQRGQARHLAKVVANLDVRYDTDTNRPIPLYCTAIGRTLISGRPEADWLELLGDGPYPALTPHTITDRDRILAMIGQARREGYAIVMEEFALGGTGLATPVRDAAGAAIAVLNVGCVTNRFHDKREIVIAAVQRAAGAISKALGAGPS